MSSVLTRCPTFVSLCYTTVVVILIAPIKCWLVLHVIHSLRHSWGLIPVKALKLSSGNKCTLTIFVVPMLHQLTSTTMMTNHVKNIFQSAKKKSFFFFFFFNFMALVLNEHKDFFPYLLFCMFQRICISDSLHSTFFLVIFKMHWLKFWIKYHYLFYKLFKLVSSAVIVLISVCCIFLVMVNLLLENYLMQPMCNMHIRKVTRQTRTL